MQKYKVGSNQFKTRHTYLRPEAWASVWMMLFFSSMLFNIFSSEVISPCPLEGCGISKVEAAGIEAKIELTQLKEKLEKESELKKITAYIVEKFQPHGRDVAVRALACFISESGLRSDAENWNPPYTDIDGKYHEATYDYGVVQLNDKWQQVTKEQGFDWKFSIDRAEKVYVSRGKNFSAWYGRQCN